MNAAADPEIFYKGERLTVGLWNNVFLVLWRAKPQLTDIEPLRRGYDAMVGRSAGEKFLVWVIIEPQVGMPEDNVRVAIANAMDAVARQISASLAVMEATGFVAVAVRAVLTAITAFSRKEYPSKFFSTADEAATWGSAWVTGADARPVAPAVLVQKVRSFRTISGGQRPSA